MDVKGKEYDESLLLNSALKILTIPDDLTVSDAMEYIHEVYFLNNDDKKLSFDEFAQAIAHLFEIGNLDELEPKPREMIKNAIINLFCVFDTNDSATLTKENLEAGFNLFLPDNKTNQFKIIHDPLELKTALEIFKKIDVEKTGAITLEQFENYLHKNVKTKKDLKNFTKMLNQNADQHNIPRLK